MMYVTADDLRQSFVVAKNEMRKFVRGKKFTLYVVLITAVFLLITLLPYATGGSLGNTPGEIVSNYVNYIPFLVILAATLFASVVMVSEFEERTALILFTRPIKRTSIFVGKVIGCILLELTMIVAFYAAIAVLAFVLGGSISIEILVSMGLTALYAFAASAFAIFISSVMKRGSTAAILTFVILLLIIPIVSGILSTTTDTWFMLTDASDAISTSIPEYLEAANARLQAMLNTPEIAAMFELFGIEIEMTPAPDVLKTAAVMLVWGIVPLVMAWIAFIKREF